MPAAQIWTNANIITLDEAQPRARGLCIEGGEITLVFDEPPIGLEGERFDLGGAVVLPGLVDSHCHLRLVGQNERHLDLRGIGTPDEIVAMVRAEVRELPPGTWIRGRGWDQQIWPEPVLPSARLLDDAAPGHPVWLERIAGHSVWLNTAALARSGITAATPDPEGGEIIRHPDGEPTGVLIDNAIDLARERLPSETDEERRADLVQGIARCHAAGLTGVHDMGTSPAELVQLRLMEEEERLGLRVTCYLFGEPEELAPLLATAPKRGGLVRVVGVKLFTDGALGSHGAALLEPYGDRPQSSGLLLNTPEELTARAATVHAAGYQLAVHAIGDRANRIALDAIVAAQDGDSSRRHRIEHAQILHPEDWPRLSSSGVVASMQPIHHVTDLAWAGTRLGDERLAGAYAWRRILDQGVPLAFGSDAPVASENPWLGIRAAATRRDTAGAPSDQRLSVREALLAYTRGAAYATGDDDPGVIRPGARADLTVVDRDPEATDPEKLGEVQTLRVVVAGQEVFRAPGAS